MNGRPARWLRAAAIVVLAAGWARAEFHAGAARRPITPRLDSGPVWLAGFGQNRAATGIHDELWARCAALGDGKRAVALCSVDLIGLFLDEVQQIRAAVRERFSGLDVIVTATHVHEGPDTMGLWGPRPGASGRNPEYNRLVIERVAEAAQEAAATMRPATLRAARLASQELESFIHDTRPPVVLDAELIVLALDGRERKPIATLVNWANHPETLGSRNTLVTADYPAFFYQRLEQRRGGVAILFNGAVGGMQSPLGATVRDPATGQPAPEASFRKAELIGSRVADLACEALTRARRLRVDAVRYRETEVRIPLANPAFLRAMEAGVFGAVKRLEPDGTLRTLVGLLRLDSRGRPLVEAAMIPGEAYPELSRGGIQRYPGADFPDAPLEKPLKQTMTAPYRMLVGLANDEIGYIIPKAEWDEKPPWLNNAPKSWYGEINSVGPEAAPRIASAFEELARGRQ
ncbi:MAG: hypothetical protein ACP5U2_03285 [Bryobacteraceae bacterium]